MALSRLANSYPAFGKIMRKLALWLIIIALTWLGIEIASFVGLFFLKEIKGRKYQPINVLRQDHREILNRLLNETPEYFKFSRDLGWSIRKNGRDPLYQANSQGIRGEVDYSFLPTKDTLRIASFGDSFTHCDDVANHQTWQHHLETFNSNLEVLNFGVGGFGLDQAYIRYTKEGFQYNPKIVLIGFMSENIFRNVNTFRPFYYRNTIIPLSKPRFVLDANELLLIDNPFQNLHDYQDLLRNPPEVLAKIGRYDYFYLRGYQNSLFDFLPTVRLYTILANYYLTKLQQPIILKRMYNVNSEAYQITLKIFEKFYKDVIDKGSIPIIVIFPNKEDIERYRVNKSKRYQPLLTDFQIKGYNYIDVMEAFFRTDRSYKNSQLFKKPYIRKHYTPFANNLVAEHFCNYLNTKGLLNASDQDCGAKAPSS